MSSIAELISREAVIHLAAAVSEVFPLFEPLNEKLWVDEWNPRILYPATGRATEGMVFTTKPRFAGEADYAWILTRLDPFIHLVQYTVYVPERIWFIKVHCTAAPGGTKATISYSYLGLTPEGHKTNQVALEQMFANELRDWEAALNGYLDRCNRLQPGQSKLTS